MSSFQAKLLSQIFPVSPYDGFDYKAYPVDLRTEPVDPLFEQLITMVKPRLIVEIGSWKGSSAIHMASVMKQQGLSGTVMCVDTWLGSLEHFLNRGMPGWETDRFLKNGYSTLYYQFLANVCHSGMQDMIVPFPNTSNMAARWLAWHHLSPDLVYVDGSHEFADVYLELTNYWDLVRDNGVLFGDDYCCQGVIGACNKFAQERTLDLRTTDKSRWVLIKKPDSIAR